MSPVQKRMGRNTYEIGSKHGTLTRSKQYMAEVRRLGDLFCRSRREKVDVYLNKKEEIIYFKKYGICPHLPECFDSTDCNGKVYEFCRCRARDIKPEI